MGGGLTRWIDSCLTFDFRAPLGTLFFGWELDFLGVSWGLTRGLIRVGLGGLLGTYTRSDSCWSWGTPGDLHEV
jgi:hypothetical protein